MKINFILFFIPVLILSCQTSMEIEGFDPIRWANEDARCTGLRDQMAVVLQSNFPKLKGLSQQEVKNFLGKPIRHELYNRTQKFFYYPITCGTDSIQQELVFRFDALGNLRELSRIKTR